MKQRKFVAAALALALALSAAASALADTIRLRDGSIIRGQIIGYKDQQFTVLIGGARGRRSRITIYMEDVDSIEFDNSGNDSATGPGNEPAEYDTNERQPSRTAPADMRPATVPSQRTTQPADTDTGRASSAPAGTGGAPVFFPIRLRVRADNAANGWTDSGLMVRRGQRLRVSAQGRVNLGGGIFSTPTGLPRQTDRDKLMHDQPTGGLIAVIGDDNDEFIFIGASREFTAQRDGRLFLGINEGNLNDNSGAYEVTVEAEAISGSRP